MQHLNWDDLRVFLAVDRHGSFTQAARALRLDTSTVGRRMTRLEEALDVVLFDRMPAGPRITATGIAIRSQVATFESAVTAVTDRAGANSAAAGRVRLATTELLMPLLMQHLPSFRSRFPDIELDLVVGRASASVIGGEADLALRLKPSGSRDVASPTSIARRLATVTFAAWAHRALAGGSRWPAVRYITEEAPWVPGREWTDANTRPSGVRVGSMTGLLDAVERKLGVGVMLDCLVAGRGSPDLVPVAERLDAGALWIVQRRDNRTFTRIRAVVDWLDAIPWEGLARG